MRKIKYKDYADIVYGLVLTRALRVIRNGPEVNFRSIDIRSIDILIKFCV